MFLGTVLLVYLIAICGNHSHHGNKELYTKSTNMRKYFKFIFGTNILCDNMY